MIGKYRQAGLAGYYKPHDVGETNGAKKVGGHTSTKTRSYSTTKGLERRPLSPAANPQNQKGPSATNDLLTDSLPLQQNKRQQFLVLAAIVSDYRVTCTATVRKNH